ncbi:MAG: WD40 repeat domain-containing protein [Myxococcales bacterium]|nr:WD40 repeat domain-containing protein [Myxococcales bacterium]
MRLLSPLLLLLLLLLLLGLAVVVASCKAPRARRAADAAAAPREPKTAKPDMAPPRRASSRTPSAPKKPVRAASQPVPWASPRARHVVARLPLPPDHRVLALSPRLRWLVSFDIKRFRLSLWDVQKRRVVRALGRLSRPNAPRANVSFSADERAMVGWVITDFYEKKLEAMWLYRLDSRAAPRRLQTLPKRAAALSSPPVFDAKARRIAAFTDGLVVWSTRTGRVVKRCPSVAPASEVGGIEHPASFSPDGAHVVAGGHDGPTPVLRVRDCKKTLALLERDKLSAVEAAFSPDGRFIAAISWTLDGAIFDARSGKLLHHLATPKLRDPPKLSASLVFSRSGRYLAATNRLQTRCWMLSTGKPVALSAIARPEARDLLLRLHHGSERDTQKRLSLWRAALAPGADP